jgi:hypothetical protein
MEPKAVRRKIEDSKTKDGCYQFCTHQPGSNIDIFFLHVHPKVVS